MVAGALSDVLSRLDYPLFRNTKFEGDFLLQKLTYCESGIEHRSVSTVYSASVRTKLLR